MWSLRVAVAHWLITPAFVDLDLIGAKLAPQSFGELRRKPLDPEPNPALKTTKFTQLVPPRPECTLLGEGFVTGSSTATLKIDPAGLRDRCVRLELDERALARKRAAAENYPEMKTEVEAAISKFGLEVFAIELFRPVTSDLAMTLPGEPYYETHGENRVKEGHYLEVIRYRQHVDPLIRALYDKLDLPA